MLCLMCFVTLPIWIIVFMNSQSHCMLTLFARYFQSVEILESNPGQFNLQQLPVVVSASVCMQFDLTGSRDFNKSFIVISACSPHISFVICSIKVCCVINVALYTAIPVIIRPHVRPELSQQNTTNIYMKVLVSSQVWNKCQH